MNWIIVFVSVTILALGGAGYWWFYMRPKDDKLCCPKGYTRDYNHSVNVAAKCDKKTQRCEKCIGTTAPPKDWPNKVSKYSGGIHVTAPKC